MNNQWDDDLALLDEIENELEDYRRETRYKKLTREQWDRLNKKLQTATENVHDRNELYASGEHYELAMMLREFGYYPEGRFNIVNTAWEIVIRGYE